jgi:uncharacterized protein (DUF2164 family)
MRGKPTITLSPEARDQAITSLKRYLAENMDHDIGDLKGALLLDYILEEIGPSVYNQAIADARQFFEERIVDLDGVCFRAEFPFWGKSGRS